MGNDYFKSGSEGLDKKLDYIRSGENVILRVTKIQDFCFFSGPFLKEQLREGRKVVYLRFGNHEPLTEYSEDFEIRQLDPSIGFEIFTLAVHEIVEEAGEGAFFLFDSLSQLQQVWYSDLMMDNFMRVTAPFIHEKHSVALFPISRGVHSYDSVNRIRECSQVFIDVFSSGTSYYVTPLKVENRYHAQMFLTHRVDADGRYYAMTYSTSLSRYYRVLDEAGPGEQMQDSWEDFFIRLRARMAEGKVEQEDLNQMCGMMMSRDKTIRKMIHRYFTARDYMTVKNRMVGTGLIGGKACGMLLARKLVREFCPLAQKHLESHDSYYLASDIYYTYIIHNDCWQLWMYQKKHPEDKEAAQILHNKLLNGVFPGNIRRQFRRMLDYFGTCPIIVRSSSLLEDGFGNAFAGKYDSVFCVSTGNMDERMMSFQDAVKQVYASTMSPSALEYRRVRGLLKKDEQMALLVQRVSGSRWNNYYFPMAAGVGFSYNSYPWNKSLDPEAGMLRLVVGLGTRAVDRTPGDYPRLVNLDKPQLTTFSTLSDRHRFSQHNMDVLNLEKNELETCSIHRMTPVIPFWQKKYMFSHDRDTEQMFRDRGEFREILFADCGQLVQNQEFIDCMQEILKTLQEHYNNPVDIEYTVNISETGEFQINLLQCRPLQTCTGGSAQIPDYDEEDTFFHIRQNVMGFSRQEKIDMVVFVDPHAYYEYPYARKTEVARTIGKINNCLKEKEKTILLVTPGRVCTSSPELGVPVAYAEISQFSGIMEVSYSKAGYQPELSFGSHIFQDLVEADIFYVACMENQDTLLYRPEYLENGKEIFQELIDESMKDVVKVYDMSDCGLMITLDSRNREALCSKKKGGNPDE